MKTKSKLPEEKFPLTSFLYVVLCMIAVYCVVWAFTGMWPWVKNDYNSYSLQAARWLQGHLDLGTNYSHLEIAEYQGKFFVSFPPFPSYVMLPFVLLFGEKTPDGWIALATSITGALYVFKLLKYFRKSDNSSIFWTLFVTVGTNLIFIAVNGWVWFIAQNLCFMLSVMAIYYAATKQGGLSLAFWACSVGCRPFNALYAPILLYILYRGLKEDRPTQGFWKLVSSHLKWAIAPCIIAASYMLLNYLRFDSIFEFGHNYLPEFQEAAKGQFHLDYIKTNFPLLLKLPPFDANGKVMFPKFNGTAFYLVTPVFFSYVIYLIYGIIIKKDTPRVLLWLIPCSVIVHLLLLTAHKTMGGFHFGNRYPIDALPYAFLGILYLMNQDDRLEKIQYPLAVLGLLINVIGTCATYNSWI